MAGRATGDHFAMLGKETICEESRGFGMTWQSPI
jgi:hypothetical protein